MELQKTFRGFLLKPVTERKTLNDSCTMAKLTILNRKEWEESASCMPRYLVTVFFFFFYAYDKMAELRLHV